MSPLNDIRPVAAERRRAFSRWWDGVGGRVFLVMSAAILVVSVLIGLFFIRVGKTALEAEIRARILYVSRYLAALAAEDIQRRDRRALQQKLDAAFQSYHGLPGDSDLHYLAIASVQGDLMAHRSQAASLSGHAGRNGGTAPVPQSPIDPAFSRSSDNLYTLSLPVTVHGDLQGYVLVGVSGRWHSMIFEGVVRKAAYVLAGSMLVGLVMSQVIARRITRPVAQLNAAIQDLERQNWQTPIVVTGRDEISSLGRAFNQMALTIRQRDASLSQANRDLFQLHAAGLDLMESLRVEDLLPRIARRATDLVQADTVLVTTIDRASRSLKTLGAFGSRAEALLSLDMPLESGGLYNWIVSYGMPILIPEATADFRLDRSVMERLGIRSLMTSPLWSSTTMVGLLTIVNRRGGGSFDKQAFRLFSVFSNLAGAALQNAMLYGDLKRSMESLEQTREQLIHSTKLAAIGELAANVAHEINNPLTSVLGYAGHLLKTADLPEPQARLLRMMEQETLRVRKIIRNLLDFARQRPASLQPADLLHPLRETVSLIQGVATSSAVEIREEYNGDPLVVVMDPNEVKQVFINIVTNALQAMPGGGTLTISAGGTAGGEVAVSFTDTGVGIAEEHRAKIFEPFFSTKSDGSGTGLGLSISDRIVRQHGGRIEVESVPGRGSTFRVIFPRAADGGRCAAGSA